MNNFGVRSTGGSAVGPTGVWATASMASGSRPLVVCFAVSLALRAPLAALFVKYSHIPSRPPSRPNPLSLYPPNPAAASNRFVEFTHTTPALIFGATSSARLMLSVHTLAASPYGVLFASATDSSGVRKVIVTSTGPKISTCAIVDDGWTSVKSVGG